MNMPHANKYVLRLYKNHKQDIVTQHDTLAHARQDRDTMRHAGLCHYTIEQNGKVIETNF